MIGEYSSLNDDAKGKCALLAKAATGQSVIGTRVKVNKQTQSSGEETRTQTRHIIRDKQWQRVKVVILINYKRNTIKSPL